MEGHSAPSVYSPFATAWLWCLRRLRSIPCDDGATEGVVHADGTHIDVLLDAVGAVEGPARVTRLRLLLPMKRWSYSTATDQPGANPMGPVAVPF